MATEPAFPGDRFPGSKDKHSGMSLRDYFAGQALVALRGHSNAAWVAQRCYEIADAMMEVRNK